MSTKRLRVVLLDRLLLVISIALASALLVSPDSATAQTGEGPSALCHITDGTFTDCNPQTPGNEEWSDITPTSFTQTGGVIFVDQADLVDNSLISTFEATKTFPPGFFTPDGELDHLMLMYEGDRTVPLGPDEYVLVHFMAVDSDQEILQHYVVRIYADATIQVFIDGVDQGPGRKAEIDTMMGAVGFGISPTNPTPHVLSEFQIGLEEAGFTVCCYSADPAWWSSSTPPEPTLIARIKAFAEDNRETFAEIAEFNGLVSEGARLVFDQQVCLSLILLTKPELVLPCEIVTLGVHIGFAGKAILFDELSESDPHDLNFMEIAQPVAPSLSQQPYTTADGLTQDEADALNALLTNIEEQIGLARAILTAIDRAQGAFLAGDSFWEIQQVLAARQFASQLVPLLEAEPTLLADLQSAIEATGLQVTFTLSDVVNFQATASADGLSPEAVQGLTELGFDSSEQEKVQQLILTEDPNKLAALGGGGFPEMLTDPSVITALQEAAAALTPDVFGIGDVFVSVSDGQVQWRSPGGNLNQTLTVSSGFGFTTGMAFDATGNLYVTEFSAQSVSQFDTNGNLLGTFGSGYNQSPESILFDKSGNAYVGQADGTEDILKFDSQGNLLAAFDVAIENRGSNWIDLASDQCTLFYTSEGPSIKRFNVCNNMQLPDFATGVLHSAGFALRLLPDGGLLVTDFQDIDRLDASGQVVQTYDVPGENCWFALNLDPDGASFWSADVCTSNVYKFDIASGAQLLSFNTGTPSSTVFGLAVRGEPPPDSDDDGVLDAEDNCPQTSNSGQQDSNLDGIGNACQGTTALDTTAFLQANLDGSSGAEATDPTAGEPPLDEQLTRIIDFRINTLNLTIEEGNDFLSNLVDSQVVLGLVDPTDAGQLVSDVLQQIVVQIDIDIKPGSDPNSINCNNDNQVIAVAILTTETFDATTVDHTTVTFEGAGETHVDNKSGEPRRHEEDVDGDGDADLVFHFRLGDAGLTCEATEGTVTGETFDGISIEGIDAVRMIDQGGGKP